MAAKITSWVNTFRWFHATRMLGVLLVVYGLLFDDSPERGTILLGGFGLLGLEKVARSEPKA